MDRQLLLEFPPMPTVAAEPPAPMPAPQGAQTLEERFADIENPDDRRLAMAVCKNRWNIRKLLQYMVFSTGSVSREQQENAERILAVMGKMTERRQEVFLGKAILRMQPRIRKTRMPMPHRITIGTLRRAGRHLPYASPRDE